MEEIKEGKGPWKLYTGTVEALHGTHEAQPIHMKLDTFEEVKTNER